MAGPLITVATAGPVRTLTLSNPPANCYSYEMMRELDEAILDARFEESVHVIVLRGAGEKFFCAGADIGMLGEVSRAFKYNFCLHANETLNRLEQSAKLTIAALNGHTVGGGLEIALACDLRVARGSGKIGLPEVNLGVLPGTGGTQRLVRALGKSRALEWMVEGRVTTFAEAKEFGLVNEIFEDGDFTQKVAEYALGFAPPARASLAVGLIKRAAQSGAEMGFTEGLALERELQQRLFESSDAREGIAAYTEKRTPRFRGE